VVHSVLPTDFLGVVQRRGGVSVGNYVDVLCWKDLQCRLECVAEYRRGSIGWDEESRVEGSRLDIPLLVIFWARCIVLEDDEERSIGVTNNVVSESAILLAVECNTQD
jgi:hypothetical protein